MNIIGFIYDNHIIMWYMMHGNYYESDPGLPLTNTMPLKFVIYTLPIGAILKGSPVSDS